jgi:hypothetical protein
VNDNEKSQHQELLFLQIVSMFEVAAMQQLGKIPNPLSGTIERDIDQAKMSIDILTVIKEKTAGNLTKREEDFLGKVLFECQMNYLDELKRPEPAGAEEKGAGPRDESRGDSTTGGEEGPEAGRESETPDPGPGREKGEG